jgi:glutamate formiminotransferase
MFAECVVNVSEGRDPLVIAALAEAAGDTLLDLQADPEHHRSVLTLGGPLASVEDAARSVVGVAVARIDLRAHAGVHPRLGAADVVPFVPAPVGTGSSGRSDGLATIRAARDRFAHWAGSSLDLPCFFYGPERSLPDVRRNAFSSLEPDRGPPQPHPTAGATAAGARSVLVAYNLWITADGGSDGGPPKADATQAARALAADRRGPAVRSLGFSTASGAQVSFNVIDPASVSLADLYDAVARGAEAMGYAVERAELVGLAPAAVLAAVPRHRWPELDLSPDRTIESRMEGRWGRRAAGR